MTVPKRPSVVVPPVSGEAWATNVGRIAFGSAQGNLNFKYAGAYTFTAPETGEYDEFLYQSQGLRTNYSEGDGGTYGIRIYEYGDIGDLPDPNSSLNTLLTMPTSWTMVGWLKAPSGTGEGFFKPGEADFSNTNVRTVQSLNYGGFLACKMVKPNTADVMALTAGKSYIAIRHNTAPSAGRSDDNCLHQFGIPLPDQVSTPGDPNWGCWTVGYSSSKYSWQQDRRKVPFYLLHLKSPAKWVGQPWYQAYTNLDDTLVLKNGAYQGGTWRSVRNHSSTDQRQVRQVITPPEGYKETMYSVWIHAAIYNQTGSYANSAASAYTDYTKPMQVQVTRVKLSDNSSTTLLDWTDVAATNFNVVDIFTHEDFRDRGTRPANEIRKPAKVSLGTNGIVVEYGYRYFITIRCPPGDIQKTFYVVNGIQHPRSLVGVDVDGVFATGDSGATYNRGEFSKDGGSTWSGFWLYTGRDRTDVWAGICLSAIK